VILPDQIVEGTGSDSAELKQCTTSNRRRYHIRAMR
jgi:hypothetical protein